MAGAKANAKSKNQPCFLIVAQISCELAGNSKDAAARRGEVAAIGTSRKGSSALV